MFSNRSGSSQHSHNKIMETVTNNVSGSRLFPPATMQELRSISSIVNTSKHFAALSNHTAILANQSSPLDRTNIDYIPTIDQHIPCKNLYLITSLLICIAPFIRTNLCSGVKRYGFISTFSSHYHYRFHISASHDFSSRRLQQCNGDN